MSTASPSAAVERTAASPQRCVYDVSNAWGPWAHTLAVSGNGKPGAKVTRSLADNMVPHGLHHGGGERDYAWTPPTRPLTRSALVRVRERHLRAPYFRATARQTRQLVAKIQQAVADCPEEGLILVGYSQGALAVRSALARVAKRDDAATLLDHVGGVLLVGDPGTRRGEDVRRYGVRHQRGLVRGAPLPSVLTERAVVASWCRTADPFCSAGRVSARRAVRAHRGYRLPDDGASAARRAADYLTAPIDDAVLEAGVHWYGPDFTYGESFSGWPVVKPLTGAATDLRLDRELSAVPPGMTVADDLTLSGTAPTSGKDFTVELVFHHARFAPATHRTWSSGADVYAARAGRPGVSLVSHGLAGARPNGDSYDADVSADGRTVVFVSAASNLVAGDTDGQANVFVWDRADGTITKVSDGLGADTLQAKLGQTWPHVSADGRRITWLTSVDHPALGDTDGKSDVYLYDRDTQTTVLASPGTAANVSSATLAGDGSRVYFREADDTSTERVGDVVRTWQVSDTTTAVLTPPAGGGWLPGGADGDALVISANGRYALAHVGGAHVSWDLDGGAAVMSCGELSIGPGAGAVSDDGEFFSGRWTYVNPRDPYSVELTCDHGTTTAQGMSQAPFADLTPDGRYLTRIDRTDFQSEVTVHDRTTGTTTSAYDDRPADTSAVSSASDDALTVVFDARAFNVVETPAAQRGTREIYLWDRTVSP